MAYNKSFKPGKKTSKPKGQSNKRNDDREDKKSFDTREQRFSDRNEKTGQIPTKYMTKTPGKYAGKTSTFGQYSNSKASSKYADRDSRFVKDRMPNKKEEVVVGVEEFDENNPLQLEGRNAVLEALSHDKVIDKILLKKGEVVGTLKVIVAKAIEKGIIVQEVSTMKLNEISESGNHQGVIAMCPAHEYFEVEDMLRRAKERKEAPFLIILDEITDPHNLGAIIRTADACGAHGVIIPKRRAVGLTGIVSKTSAGAIEHVMVARVGNIVNTIDMLKKKNIWIACADMKGTMLYDAPLDGAIAVVIGSEGNGVSRLIKDKCDFSVQIPMKGKIDSLNASVAAGVVLYEVVRKRSLRRTK